MKNAISTKRLRNDSSTRLRTAHHHGSNHGQTAFQMLADQSTLRTGRKYSGINISILWTAAAAAGYARDRWLTYNQATEVGGHIRRGQKGTTAILYRDYEVQRKGCNWRRSVGREAVRPMIDTLKMIKGLPAVQCRTMRWPANRDNRRPGPTRIHNRRGIRIEAADACLEQP